MNPVERKKIGEWAKEIGIKSENISTAVELEMRVKLTSNAWERDNIIVRSLFQVLLVRMRGTAIISKADQNNILSPLSHQ